MLTSKLVEDLFYKCIIKEEEDTASAIIANGIMSNVEFSPERLENAKPQIAHFLDELPDSFKISGGKGNSFLNACEDKHGHLWGEHYSMEQLFQLGIAAGFAKCMLSKELWMALPGGMPYYVVYDDTMSPYLKKETPCGSLGGKG